MRRTFMHRNYRSMLSPALVLAGYLMLMAGAPALADGPASKPGPPAPADQPQAAKPDTPVEPTPLDLLEGLRTHKLAVRAEGTGDGKMDITITNQTTKPLLVILPPSLVASGVSGQFGGLGGLGGGAGGLGALGGG